MMAINDKHKRIRIESWCKKFCVITTNKEWKKNRNLNAIYLLNMMINQRLEQPYNKFPQEGPLPKLSKPLVKSGLSNKFLKYLSDKLKFPFLQRQQIAFSNNKNNTMNMNMTGIINRPLTPGKITFKGTSNNRNHLNEIKNCNDVDLLKKHIDKLENKINETREIILQQNEEKKILQNKINQLENLLKSDKI